MSILLNIAVPADGTYVTPAYQIAEDQDFNSIVGQATFAYGSAGTTLNCWVQTTFDQGTTWQDLMVFNFSTGTARLLVSVLRSASWTGSGQDGQLLAPPSDGQSSNAYGIDGLVGSQFRAKYIAIGSYVGSAIRIDLSRRLRKAFAAP